MYSPRPYKYGDSYVLYIPTVHAFGSVNFTHTLLVQTHTHDVSAPCASLVICCIFFSLLEQGFYFFPLSKQGLYFPFSQTVCASNGKTYRNQCTMKQVNIELNYWKILNLNLISIITLKWLLKAKCLHNIWLWMDECGAILQSLVDQYKHQTFTNRKITRFDRNNPMMSWGRKKIPLKISCSSHDWSCSLINWSCSRLN